MVPPEDTPHRPSADVFFHSLANLRNTAAAAVLLTGMGRDGAEGLLELGKAGANTYAQDQASSVVYGMPKAALNLGAVDGGSSPEAIAAALTGFATTRQQSEGYAPME